MKQNCKTLQVLLFKFLLFFGCIYQQSAQAQSKIRGKVVDKATGEALIGVSVYIKGTSLGCSTDENGVYELRLEPGTYEVSVKYILYKDLSFPGMSIERDQEIVKNIELEEESSNGKELNEAVVRAEVKKNSIAAIYVERRNGVSLSDGLSSEQFKKTPDRNVSDVLKRVSGTSIQDNKFAIIRGMNDRYNAAYLNGAPLPSTESDRKAFAFNIIPSNLIDNLMVYKSPSPDMLGDFAGGVIMVNTKSIPESKSSQLDLSIGTHSLTTFQPFYHFRNSKTDVLGFDNGTRKLPESKNYREGLSKTEYVDFTKKFNNDWRIYDRQALPSGNLSYSVGKSFKHRSNEFGALASFTYSNNNRISRVQQKKFRYDDNNLDQNFTDNQYTNNVSIGALLNLAYKIDKRHTLAFKNLYNLNSEDITTLRSGLSSGENQYYSESYSNIYSQNRILTSQISGEHLLTKTNLKLNWVLNAGNIQRAMPDYRIVSYSGEGEHSEEYMLSVNNNQFSSSSGRFYSNMQESIYSGAISYSMPFRFKFTKNELKSGLFTQLRKRDFTSRYFTYYGPWGITGNPEENLGISNISEKGVYMVEQSSPARDNYDANAKLNAAYLMMDSRLFTKFRIVYGVRYENYHQTIHTADGTNLPLKIDSTYQNYLPSLNFTWSINPKSNVRFSSGKTVNRPEFRELAAFPFFNFNLNSNIAGYTKLQPASIYNYDVRWELFPSGNEVISVGAYYKKIMNPIEMNIDVTQVAIRTYGYTNQKSAHNLGLELDYRKSFDFLGKALHIKGLEKLLFFANLSLTQSKIQFKDLSAADSKRPLQGQSPYVLNMGLQYQDLKSGWGATLNYNKIGRRIAFVGAPMLAKFGLDIYENPRTVIDVQLSKSTSKWDYKLTVGDLMAQSLVFYQDNNQNKKYDSLEDNTIYNYNMGQTVTAAIAYKFK